MNPIRDDRLGRFSLLAASVALFALATRVAIYLSYVDHDAENALYLVGCAEGFGVDLCLGMVAAAPLLARGRAGIAASSFLSVLVLLGNAIGAHYHTIFQNLPTLGMLHYLRDIPALGSSVRKHAPPALVTAEVFGATLAAQTIAAFGAPRLERLFEDGRARGTLAGLASVAVAVSAWSLHGAKGQRYYGAAGPWLFAVTHVSSEPPETPGAPSDLATELVAIKKELASDNHFGASSEFPFCAPPPEVAAKPNGKSVILLILESVDQRAFGLLVNGKPAMPNLRRMANDAVSFPRVFATGDRSSYALPSLLAGVPSVSFRPLLLRDPMPSVEGFPAELRRFGYRTAYFHGGDLSFENQRAFLKRVGFDDIVEPSPLSNEPRYGWGIPDGVLFDELHAFVVRERAARVPYFATAFTLSTHDPYELPPNVPSRFGLGKTTFGAFVETLGYLDDELARFYSWYRAEEEPRGTLLVVTGDHAPHLSFPGDPADTTTGEAEYRFNVPLLVFGLGEPLVAEAKKFSGAVVGSHVDVPATLAAALGVDPPRCQVGQNLLDPKKPEHRFVTSAAGATLSFLYAEDTRRRYMLDLFGGKVTEFDWIKDPAFRHDLAATDPRAHKVAEFLLAYARAMNALVEQDRLAPKPARSRTAHAPLPDGTAPMVAEDCNHSAGPLAMGGDPLSRIEQAVANGAHWVSVEVSVTRDGVPVVFHAKAVTGAEALRGVGVPLKLAELRATTPFAVPTLDDVVKRFAGRVGVIVVVEPSVYVEDQLALSRATLRSLSAAPEKSQFILASSSGMMRETFRQFSSFPIVATLPARVLPDNWVERLDREPAPPDWVSLDASFASPASVRAAHAGGFRVLLRNATREQLAALGAALPDGVVTEDARTLAGKE